MEKQIKKPTRRTSNVQVAQSKSVSIATLLSTINSSLNNLSTRKKTVPLVVTKGDNWMCIASVVDNICVTVNFTEITK